MPTVRFRLFGSETDASDLITMLHGLDGVERIEQVADLMPHMDDEDSSSAGMPEDIGQGVQSIELDVRDGLYAERVREFIEKAAVGLDAGVEFVDDF